MMQQQDTPQPTALPPHPALESLADAFVLVDGAWRVAYWNAAAASMLGVTREGALGREIWSVLPSLRRAEVSSCLEAIRESGVGGTVALDLIGALGGVEAVVTPSGEGLAIQIRSSARHQPYLALLQTARAGCIAVDAEWRVGYVNPAAEYLLGFARAGVEGESIWSLLPAGWEEIEACLRATREDGIGRHLRSVRPADSRRVYHLWTEPTADGGVSILFEDVTRQFRREKRLARLALEAQEANRAKSRFFAAVSHELRTPLNAIVGYTHLLSTDTYGPLPEAAKRAADRAGTCAEHLAKLVDDLLLLTSAELNRISLNLTRTRIRPILTSAAGVYRHRAEAKGIVFRVEAPDGLPEIVTDPERLRQILAALLSNAVKHTSRGEIALVVRGDEREVSFLVRDTGCGIGPEDQERIFAPFEQTGDTARSNPLEQGSGLGLSVAWNLATLLGGSLHLRESSSRGSTFELRLPVGDGGAGAAAGGATLEVQLPG